MPKSPLFSVIINCYNSEDYLEETLQSVLSQKCIDFEVILWDNMSNDNTVKIAQSFSDPRIRIFNSQSHTSLGIARNFAISKSNGKYLAFLDSDDLWNQDKLEEVKIVIEENKKELIITSNSFLIDSSSKQIGLLHKVKPSTNGLGLLINYKLSLETLVVPKKVIVENKIQFGDYSIIEEYDFVITASRYCPIYYINKPLSSWRIHDKQLSITKELDYPKELYDWIIKNKNNYSYVVVTFFKILIILKYIFICRKLNLPVRKKYIKSKFLRLIINNLPFSILDKLRKTIK